MIVFTSAEDLDELNALVHDHWFALARTREEDGDTERIGIYDFNEIGVDRQGRIVIEGGIPVTITATVEQFEVAINRA